MEISAAITSVYSTGTMSLSQRINSYMVFLVTFLNGTGIPLQGMGCVYAILFNFLCFNSLLAHWRAAWADPGDIPKTSVRRLV
jgi:hypothetical protein